MSEDITLHTNGTSQVTMVSNCFIDSYMAEANGEYVKIYLYLLRALSRDGQPFSVARMAEQLGHTQLDIKRALTYWEEQKLIRMEYNNARELCGICLLEPSSEPQPVFEAPQHSFPASFNLSDQSPFLMQQNASRASRYTGAQSEQPSADRGSSVLSVPNYTENELAEFQANDEICELIAVTEGFLQHPLSSNDINSVIFWYDTLHLSLDVIEYMIEYCLEKGHSGIRYINKVAIAWAEKGISTVAEAEQESQVYPKSWYAVMRSFGIKSRNLIPREKELINKWTGSYHLPMDIIEEACRRTIANTGLPQFDYADKILSDWFKAEVKTMADIESLDKQHQLRVSTKNRAKPAPAAAPAAPKKSSFHNFDDRPIDYKEVERKLLQS